jgi:hypothetical protein
LVSLVSKLYPSPDWFVGVSDLELCLPNGQWVEQKEINLYPYDAGTDSGPTYVSPDQSTNPQEAIRRIRPNMPNDPRSPFYDQENKEMKPLAKLYITRQRLYEKNCENNQQDGYGQNDDSKENDENDEENGKNDDDDDDEQKNYKQNYPPPRIQDRYENNCETTDWDSWSRCDNPCGEGKSIRT